MLPNSYRGKEIQINWFHASHWPGISVQCYNKLKAPCGVKPINVIRPLEHDRENLKINTDTLKTAVSPKKMTFYFLLIKIPVFETVQHHLNEHFLKTPFLILQMWLPKYIQCVKIGTSKHPILWYAWTKHTTLQLVSSHSFIPWHFLFHPLGSQWIYVHFF